VKETAAQFKKRLRQCGLTESAISAAWPEWWSESADASPSAQAELRFSVARKLGLDAKSLLELGAPRFIWGDSVKYKGFSGDEGSERPAISSFGSSAARIFLSGTTQSDFNLKGRTALELRAALLHDGASFIQLKDLLALCWGIGVPTVHLRVYPLSAKRMVAMSVCVGDRFAILLAKDGKYPAHSIFHLAHEIGHIALGHVGVGSALVDMDDPSARGPNDDPEEIAADQYALELLTGSPRPEIEVQGKGNRASELAQQSLSVGPSMRIEPGILALCYGFATKNWATANRALSSIYTSATDVWLEVNRIAEKQLNWSALTDESAGFARALLGAKL
jgi:hypothetical protein